MYNSWYCQNFCQTVQLRRYNCQADSPKLTSSNFRFRHTATVRLVASPVNKLSITKYIIIQKNFFGNGYERAKSAAVNCRSRKEVVQLQRLLQFFVWVSNDLSFCNPPINGKFSQGLRKGGGCRRVLSACRHPLQDGKELGAGRSCLQRSRKPAC